MQTRLARKRYKQYPPTGFNGLPLEAMHCKMLQVWQDRADVDRCFGRVPEGARNRRIEIVRVERDIKCPFLPQKHATT